MLLTPYNRFPLEKDFSGLIAISEMDELAPERTALPPLRGADSSLTIQASIDVGLHNQNQRDNSIQTPEPSEAMQTQVTAV